MLFSSIPLIFLSPVKGVGDEYSCQNSTIGFLKINYIRVKIIQEFEMEEKVIK